MCALGSVQGERRDEGSSVVGQGCVGLRVPVGKFWQVGGNAVKGFVEEGRSREHLGRLGLGVCPLSCCEGL